LEVDDFHKKEILTASN